MAEDNVKVAVRVRPLLQREKLAGDQPCVRIVPAHNQLILGKDRAFTFDYVLNSKCSQEEMYDRLMNNLISSCFEGYNATVFAYGQTGSGKTYTIGGGHISSLMEEEYGIIPRAIREMFVQMQEKSSEIEFTVKVSYLEIYKEELQDLLESEESPKDIHIREDDKGNTIIAGIKEVECQTSEEVMSCLVTGSSLRHTGSTQMNEHSSRSHSIFTMLIEQRWTDEQNTGRKPSETDDEELNDIDLSGFYKCSKFHFVDLAGSERAHRTGNVGDRFKESIHINSGLLSLGNVISALGDPKKKVTHIPYRDAKITRILKDSLGGNAKTLMVCCISPASTSFDESLNSLKYANRARNIRNKPIVNRDPQTLRLEEMQSEIKALREELAKQRTSLYTAGSDVDRQQDASQIKSLEQQVVRLQTECEHYRVVAEEAYKQLTDILNRELLSKSQTGRLRDWMDLMDELKSKVPHTLNKDEWENQTIIHLNNELKKCQEDLKSDEKIFAERTKEINDLKNNLQMLENERSDYRFQLSDTQEKLHKQSQLLVEQQLRIDEMDKTIKERHVSLGSSTDIELDQSSYAQQQQRAKSVPASKINRQNSNEVRKIHTSPALISLDRVLQSFRARSQLLVNQLDDDDYVRQKTFAEDEPDKDGQPFQRRGTYKISKSAKDKKPPLSHSAKSQKQQDAATGAGVDTVDSEEVWASRTDSAMRNDISTDLQRRKIKESQLKLQNANQKMRDLAINIRLKEQLIRELVKTSKESETVNKQYAERIKKLEKEHLTAKNEHLEMQKAMAELEKQETSEKRKLQSEFQKKIEAAKTRIQVVQKKKRETERITRIPEQNEKKIQGLENAVEKMRQQQDNLQRKLKEETERKSKLEREMQKEQQKTKELEIRNQQQQKILKRKTEEVAAVQRKLRHGSTTSNTSEEQERLDEQKRWLDSEVEKVLLQRQQVIQLQEDLHRREDIVSKKEMMLEEKSQLEMKKLRSSQVLSKDISVVSNKLEQVEKKLEEKSQEVASMTEDQQVVLMEEMKSLSTGKERLLRQRNVLESKLHDGTLLSPQEERRLIELDEAIEALDAAIEYKNDTIQNQRDDIRRSQILSQSEDNLFGRLQMLNLSDAKALLSKYFEKVVDLRESEHQHELQCSELEMKIDEQERLVKEMENTLEHNTLEMDRKLTQQQQEYEQQIQALMKQLGGSQSDLTKIDYSQETKIHQLEKDLYYYKKTSRDLKRKMRELMAHIGATEGVDITPDSVRTPKSNRDTPRPERSQGDMFEASTAVDQSAEPGALTPVRISRKDLRQMSQDEIQLRKSNLTNVSVTDSLEAGDKKNPWN
ncbi:kinesin-like protein KIF27 [Tubulanus polymorphus]|uniref:kinesin-like protein KIF27 n=1 Tax=Tubulanus polymorphus TaxID=672921 RepID=UPI003DA6208A